MNVYEAHSSLEQLLDRVRKLAGVGPAIERVTGAANRDVEAIRGSAEFELAVRTGNVSAYDESIAAVRQRATEGVERVAADVRGELAWLEAKIAEHRADGSFARQMGAEACARGWQRVSMQLAAGLSVGAIIEAAVAEDDREALAGLELNGPAWMRASAGAKHDDPAVSRAIDRTLRQIEDAASPYADRTIELFREARFEFEKLSTAANAWIAFGVKSAAGRASGRDLIELAFETGDVPSGPAERPNNGVVGDATGVLESLPGRRGIGVTIA